MKSFKDCGTPPNEWRLPVVTLGLLLDVADTTGVDFLEIAKKDGDPAKAAGDVLSRLYEPLYLDAVLRVMLADGIKARGLSDRDFAKLFSAEVNAVARMKLMEAVVDFILPRKAATEILPNLLGAMAALDSDLTAASANTVSDSAAS